MKLAWLEIESTRGLRILRTGLLGAIVACPLSFYVGLSFEGGGGFGTKLPLIEPLIWFLFGIWILCRRRDPTPPIPLAAPFLTFIVVNLLSFLAAGGLFSGSGIPDLVQTVDYYLILTILLATAFTARSDLRLLFTAILSLSAVVVVIAACQYALLPDATILVSSIFDDRNVMSCFMAVVLPLLFGVFVFENRKLHAISLVIAIVSIIAIISSPIALAIAFGVMLLQVRCLSPARRPLRLVPVAVAVGLSLFGTLSHTTFDRFIFEPDDINEYHEIIRRNAGMHVQWNFLRFGGPRATEVSIGTNAWLADSEEIERRSDAALQVQRRDRLLHNDFRQVRQRFLEWQAALNAIATSPVMGVGLGRYQENVSNHYTGFPKLNTLEPGSQNGFLVLTTTMGLFGLSTYFWILQQLFSMTHIPKRKRDSEIARSGSDFQGGIGLGLWGALSTFVGVNVFYDASSSHATIVLFIVMTAMISLRHERND